MTVKELPSHATRLGLCTFMALAAVGVGHAQGQAVTMPPPTFATTRSATIPLGGGGTRYLDIGSENSAGFVLEQRGASVLLQQDGSQQILSLVPIPAQRGDTFFVDYLGRTVLKVTQSGGVVSYLHNATGAPAIAERRVPPLSAPAMTASLDMLRSSAVSELKKLAGHDVTIWGTQSFSNNEAMAAEALSVLVLGVKNANGLAGRAATRIDKVTLRRNRLPDVSFKDGELVIDLNPDDAWNGRVSADDISKVLTAARAAG